MRSNLKYGTLCERASMSKKAIRKFRKKCFNKQREKWKKEREKEDKQEEQKIKNTKKIEINNEAAGYILWLGGKKRHINKEKIHLVKNEIFKGKFSYLKAKRIARYGLDLVCPWNHYSSKNIKDLEKTLQNWAQQCEIKWGIFSPKKWERKPKTLSSIHKKDESLWIKANGYEGPARIIRPFINFNGETPKVKYTVSIPGTIGTFGRGNEIEIEPKNIRYKI